MIQNPSPGQSTSAGRRDVAVSGLVGEEKTSLSTVLEDDLDQELHDAITGGDPEAVRDLVRSGADPNAVVTTKDGDRRGVVAALHTGVDSGNLGVVLILLEAGAEPNATMTEVNGPGRVIGPALHIAVVATKS